MSEPIMPETIDGAFLERIRADAAFREAIVRTYAPAFERARQAMREMPAGPQLGAFQQAMVRLRVLRALSLLGREDVLCAVESLSRFEQGRPLPPGALVAALAIVGMDATRVV